MYINPLGCLASGSESAGKDDAKLNNKKTAAVPAEMISLKEIVAASEGSDIDHFDVSFWAEFTRMYDPDWLKGWNFNADQILSKAFFLMLAFAQNENRGGSALNLESASLRSLLVPFGLNDKFLVWDKSFWKNPLIKTIFCHERSPFVTDLKKGFLWGREFFSVEQFVAQKICNLLKFGKKGVLLWTSEDARWDNFWKSQKIFKNSRGEMTGPNEEQMMAVKECTKSNLFIISGGPGTGKTAIIRIIKNLLEAQGIDLKSQLAMATFTGKASTRINEVLFSGGGDGSGDSSRFFVGTIHRLLGASKKRAGFRQNRFNPLPYSWVIIDEASMLDLKLFAALLEATRPDAHLILLGDSDQLPSVGVGNILADLRAVFGERKDVYCELKKNYRMNTDNQSGSQIYKASQEVREGRLPAIAAVDFGNIEQSGISRMEIGPDEMEEIIESWIRLHLSVKEPEKDNIESYLNRVKETQILAPTRIGPFGTERINEIARKLYGNNKLQGSRFIEWEPVIVTQNDYELDLNNGDIGIIGMLKDEDGITKGLGFFYMRKNSMRSIPLEDVEHILDYAYALTIHKGQGSEYERVMLVLPDTPTDSFMKCHFYTTITRARQQVLIIGKDEVLQSALSKGNLRSSNLGGWIEAFGNDV
ncbi:MAG: AAA family ATPase [Oligoflexales bacterium]|nr:AAA family ATPase [Oligoflexales bacterium]